MSDGIEALKAAYVSQMQRAYHTLTRGIATPEDRQQWEADAEQVIREAKAKAWDEGKRAVYDFQHSMIHDPGLKPPANPYRGGQ